MAGVSIPTLAQQTQIYLSAIAARLNQTLPVQPQAFVNVLSFAEASGDYVLFKLAVDRFMAAFWSTAQGSDLDFLGSEYNLPRQTAVGATITATQAATDGTVVPIGTIYNCQANGLQYQVTAQVTAPFPGGTGTGVTITLLAILPTGQGGAASNLANGVTLNIASPIAGAALTALVASTVTVGLDAEGDPAYRARGLNLVQTTPTGSNPASYRLNGLTVAGIVGIYPYSGNITAGTSYPGQRTIYVECSTSIQVDGIPGGSWTGSTGVAVGLVGQVATAIRTNAFTGLANEDAGLTAANLFVLPISRTSVYVQVSSLNVPSGQTAAAQADITSAVNAYLLAIKPFVSGVDPTFTQNNNATQGGISAAIQAVMATYGASYLSVSFGVINGTWLSSYQVGQGEKLKLIGGAVSFV